MKWLIGQFEAASVSWVLANKTRHDREGKTNMLPANRPHVRMPTRLPFIGNARTGHVPRRVLVLISVRARLHARRVKQSI